MERDRGKTDDTTHFLNKVVVCICDVINSFTVETGNLELSYLRTDGCSGTIEPGSTSKSIVPTEQ
jgi:hypothetical protein